MPETIPIVIPLLSKSRVLLDWLGEGNSHDDFHQGVSLSSERRGDSGEDEMIIVLELTLVTEKNDPEVPSFFSVDSTSSGFCVCQGPGWYIKSSIPQES